MSGTGSSNRSTIVQTIPKETLGLHVLYDYHGADIDVVAVHGLRGDAFKTWQAADGNIWLKDQLPLHLREPPQKFGVQPINRKIRVLTFGYNASFEAARLKAYRLETVARSLLVALKHWRAEGREKRPIIFIGHSLGGNVIKKALCIAHRSKHKTDDYNGIYQSTKHIFFFGTPHRGAEGSVNSALNFLTLFKLTEHSSLFRGLKQYDPELFTVNNDFEELAQKFEITSFYELRKRYGVKIVKEGSAYIGIPSEKQRPLHRDHHSICKFSLNEAGKDYETVFRSIREVIMGIEGIKTARFVEGRWFNKTDKRRA